jgi:hypothetical protein
VAWQKIAKTVEHDLSQQPEPAGPGLTKIAKTVEQSNVYRFSGITGVTEVQTTINSALRSTVTSATPIKKLPKPWNRPVFTE